MAMQSDETWNALWARSSPKARIAAIREIRTEGCRSFAPNDKA